MTVILIIKGLTEASRKEVICKFSGYNITLIKLRSFLKTFATAKVSLTSNKKVRSKKVRQGR